MKYYFLTSSKYFRIQSPVFVCLETKDCIFSVYTYSVLLIVVFGVNVLNTNPAAGKVSYIWYGGKIIHKRLKIFPEPKPFVH